MTRNFRTQTAAIIATCGLAATCALAQSEIEPNETKALATPLSLPAGGGVGVITGTTTGASATAGETSLDQFRLTGPAAPLGIYRNTLTITTTGTAGHTGSIRGLNQTTAGAGIPGVAGTTDTAIVSSSTATLPRSNVWYSFGKQEQFFYRVTGGTATTAPYSVDYTVTPVTPVAGPSSIPAGPVTISTIGQTTVDTDFWVYDSNFNAIPGFGCDDETAAGGGTGATAQGIVTRTLTPGTYFVAISNYNFANNQTSPGDDDWRTGPITDFADIAVSSSTAVNQDYDVLINDQGVRVTGPALAYGIGWVQFTVVPPTSPTPPTGVAGTTLSANNCGGATTLLTVTATPGANPTSTGITVTGDLTNIGGSSAQAFVDNGTGGDVTAGDNIFSFTATVAAGTPAGARSISYTIADAQARSSTASGSVTVTSCPAVNDECANAIVIPSESTSFPFSTGGATNSTGFTYCAGSGADVFYSWTAPASGATTIDTCGANGDTVLAVFSSCAGGASIVCDDDADVGTACEDTLQSVVTFGAVEGTTYIIAVRNWSSANPVITGNINIQAASGILVDAAFDTAGANNCGDDTVLLTAVVTPNATSTGLAATADLTTLGGPSSQALFDNGTNGDVTAGDNTFSFLYTVPNTVTTGAKTVTVSASDLEGRTATDTASITVGVCPPAAPACPAGAVAITATNINSGGALTGGNFANGSASATVSGAGFNADTIRISGLVQEVNIATWATELRLRVTSPTGATYDFQPSPVADPVLGGTAIERGFDEPAVAGGFRSFASLELPITAEPADGVWTVLAYEGAEVPASTVFDDIGLDATWLNLCVTISGAPTLPTCGSIDFNGDGLFPDDNDLVEFLTVLAGGDCSPGNTCGSIDYNSDGLFPDDNDLVDFLTVLAGGTPASCTP